MGSNNITVPLIEIKPDPPPILLKDYEWTIHSYATDLAIESAPWAGIAPNVGKEKKRKSKPAPPKSAKENVPPPCDDFSNLVTIVHGGSQQESESGESGSIQECSGDVG